MTRKPAYQLRRFRYEEVFRYETAEGLNLTKDLPREIGYTLEDHFSFTLYRGRRPIACGGIIQEWNRRYSAWMYTLLPFPRESTLALVRAGEWVLSHGKGRVEATVRRDFAPAHRLLGMLGFVIENPPGVLHAYGPDQEDHISYVRFNP